MPRKKADPAHRIALGADVTIRSVAGLHHDLMEKASLPEAVTIDASEVSRLDTAAVQALLAFVRERRGQGHEVAWDGISERFEEVVGRLGLAVELGLPTGGAP